METNKKIKKNEILKIVLVISLVIAVAILAGFAYARYVTSLNGQAQAQIARFSFKVNTATNNENFRISLAQTKNVQKSESGNSNYIEPGDCGVFDLVMDATGSDVSLVYNIEMDLSSMPKNLILYADEQMMHKIPVIDNSSNGVINRKIKVEDFIGMNDNSQIQTKRVYWQWAFETGTSEIEIEENDTDDSRYMGHTVEMSVNVVAKQVMSEPIYLAKKVNVGDLVNYNANISDENGNTFTTPYSYKVNGEDVGFETYNQTFSSIDSMTWKVLYKNEDFGIVELISADGTSQKLLLGGREAFKNSITILDNISKVYGYGYGAVGSRSPTINDIEQYSSYDKTTYQDSSSGLYYGRTVQYTSGDYFFEQIKDKNGNVIAYNSTAIGATSSKPVEMKHTNYRYSASNYFSNIDAYNTLFLNANGENRTYWLATRSTTAYAYAGFCVQCLFRVIDGDVGGINLSLSDGRTHWENNAVSPVIILDTTLKTYETKNENEEWEIILDNVQ